MPTSGYQGRCLCGAIRYRVVGEARNLCYCHCRSCRLAAGAPLVAWATFDRAGFQVQGALAFVRSSEHVRRGRCGACGTAITYAHDARPDDLDVTLATIDPPADLRPECHIWTADMPPWVALADGLPRFPGWRDAAE
jgi:hypothetical protein